MGHATVRSEDNTHDTPFHLEFKERVYVGSPRWWNSAWTKHTGFAKGEHGKRLARVKEVDDLIRLAGDYQDKFFKETMSLVTCMNPECPLRSWFAVNKVPVGHNSVKLKKQAVETPHQPREAFDQVLTKDDHDEISHGRAWMAGGRTDHLKKCPWCPNKRYVFAMVDIKDKWVYVLQENGNSLTPVYEIELSSSSKGRLHLEYSNKRFTDKTVSFNGTFPANFEFTKNVWHFFLSPVRLGPEALNLLQQSPRLDPIYAKLRDEANLNGIFGMPELQPWVTTVRRAFTAEQVDKPFEYIPLVDAFTWAAQIADFDYLPILAAQQQLVQDPGEQAKAFVAATLHQIVAEGPAKGNPPVREKADQWDVNDHLVGVPGEYFGKAKDIGEAWVLRYRAALNFLTDEADYACKRLCFPVRFSAAHLIIERGCQENADLTWMGFGLMHWAHILREMLMCKSGEAFMAWLARSGEAKERIPQKDILGGKAATWAKFASQFGHGLPVHLLTYLSPMIIAQSQNPAQDLSRHLGEIDIEVKTLGLGDVLAMKDFSVDLSGSIIDRYINAMPAKVDPNDLWVAAKIHKGSRLANWKERLQSLKTFKTAQDAMSVLTSMAEYGNKKEGRYLAGFDAAGEAKEKVETAKKVIEFLGERSQNLIRLGFGKGTHLFEAAEKIEKREILQAEELELLKGSRTLRLFQGLELGKRLLSGPVALIIGGIDLVLVQPGKLQQAANSGDRAALVAAEMEMAATALMVMVAAAETVALFTGAAAVAWAGPVGMIAAALIIFGSLVKIFGAENDLQLFADFCFLGKKAGTGSYDKAGNPWMDEWGWAALEDPLHARVALLRLLSRFSTWTGIYYAPRPIGGAHILPGYVPDGAFFEVNLEVTPQDKEVPRWSYKAIIRPSTATSTNWILDAWTSQEKPKDRSIEMVRDGNRIERITIRPQPEHYDGKIVFDFYARLRFDASGIHTLPADADVWVANKHKDRTDGWNQVNSDDAAKAGEEREGEGE